MRTDLDHWIEQFKAQRPSVLKLMPYQERILERFAVVTDGAAKFEHASTAGWATYQRHRLPTWRTLLCKLAGGHAPHHPLLFADQRPNGYNPASYSRCRRCNVPLKYLRLGQHRYGGPDMTAYTTS